MKVKELIAALQECDPELEVFCWDESIKSVTESATRLAFDFYKTKDGVPAIVTDRYVDLDTEEIIKVE